LVAGFGVLGGLGLALCLGDALFRQRHPRVESMQDAAIDDAAAAVDATASAPAPTDLESYER
jgi:hypothetical protein